VASPAATVKALLEDLTGQEPPFPGADLDGALERFGSDLVVGYSQLNEILLLLGYDRVSQPFFQYLVDGATQYSAGAAIRSVGSLEQGVRRFQKLALLLFGNVKFAFKRLSRETQELIYAVGLQTPRDATTFEARHAAIRPIERIPGADTYLLGYLVQRDLASRLQANPNDREAVAAEEKRQEIVERGKRNHEAYLASDHLDVYVATSMRERHEFLLVSDLTAEILDNKTLQPLNLRWFDPTQAYCADRVDKGLAEALMLKRAKCTLYFAQETDTLGKDSELASTLAQGKPVIAYVPAPDESYLESLLSRLQATYPDRDVKDLVLAQLRIFQPAAAWTDDLVRRWLDDPSKMDLARAKEVLATAIKLHYDRRARMLREDHPLGIQVNLTTGVANGVLVSRTPDHCAELIRRVLTTELEFDLDTKTIEGRKYVFLKETTSGCIFRVMTGDAMLTNSFWNFYLTPQD